MSNLDEYYQALKRLRKNVPIRIEKNTKISKDAVALEAGRKKGSIKKSRNGFHDLIMLIEKARLEQASSLKGDLAKIENLKKEVSRYKLLYEQSLGRELMLVKKLYELDVDLKIE